MQVEMYSPFAPPTIGKQAIEETHADWVAEWADGKRTTVLSASQDGDLSWCLLEFSEGTTGSGVSLKIQARQADGRWLITHSSLNEMLC